MSKKMFLFALSLSVLSAAPARAFNMEVHLGITETALTQLGYDAATMTEIKRGNELTDDDELNNSAAHFDSEKFEAGSSRLRRKLGDIVEHLAACRIDKAREEIGRCHHAIQDFFAHSNFIEISPYAPIDMFQLKNPGKEAFCNPPNFQGPLTSGYWPDDKRPYPHKCTHAELAKDGPDTGSRHELAKAHALRETVNFLKTLEERIEKRFPNSTRARRSLVVLKGDPALLRKLGLSCLPVKLRPRDAVEAGNLSIPLPAFVAPWMLLF